jgi:hypothetical protein
VKFSVWRHSSTTDGPRYWRGWLTVQHECPDRKKVRGQWVDVTTRMDVLTLHADVAWFDKASHAGFSVETDDEAGLRVFVGLWKLVNAWGAVGSPALRSWRYRRGRARGKPFKVNPELNLVSLHFHGRAVWWQVWHPKWEHKRGTPRWRYGSFQAWDWLVGKPVSAAETLFEEHADLLMPEGVYRCTVVVRRRVWLRKRWPALVTVGYEVTPDADVDGTAGYIPVPGKGENSWDCGPDGVYSQAGPLTDPVFAGLTDTEHPLPRERELRTRAVDAALAGLRGSVLETRRRRGAPADYAEAI